MSSFGGKCREPKIRDPRDFVRLRVSRERRHEYADTCAFEKSASRDHSIT